MATYIQLLHVVTTCSATFARCTVIAQAPAALLACEVHMFVTCSGRLWQSSPKGFPPRIRSEPPPKCWTRQAGEWDKSLLGRPWKTYESCRTCCSNVALDGGMLSIVREPCANNYFLASFTPLAEHILLYMTKMIFARVSELTSPCSRDRSRKASATLHANHADFFPATEEARHSITPTDSMEEH